MVTLIDKFKGQLPEIGSTCGLMLNQKALRNKGVNGLEEVSLVQGTISEIDTTLKGLTISSGIKYGNDGRELGHLPSTYFTIREILEAYII